jgi:glycosyltransferase involved in cell wall biosynthesis
VTYNQRQFIGECLQSLVDQRTPFEFEILVADDGSTDGTSEIVAGFAHSHPGVVVHMRHERNLGAYGNFHHVHAEACRRAAYVAHVDGDDLVLPGKLAAQVDVLERRHDVALSAHAVRVIDSTRLMGADDGLPELGTMDDLLLRGTYFVNSSTMYRASQSYPGKPDHDVVDFYTHIEHASFGLIHLNKQPLGAYRWHDAGISKSEAHRQRIETAYERAFDRAAALGASAEVVTAGRLLRRRSFALARLIAGDRAGFRRGIALSNRDWTHASMQHRLLSAGRGLIRGFVARLVVDRLTRGANP